MPNNIILEETLEKFASEVEDALIATGIVNNDGTLQAYVTHGDRGTNYNVERSASIFAMMVNVLNNTLCDIYNGIENVRELKATTKNSCFLFRLIENGRYFHGVTFTSGGDSKAIRQLMEKYEGDFISALK